MMQETSFPNTAVIEAARKMLVGRSIEGFSHRGANTTVTFSSDCGGEAELDLCCAADFASSDGKIPLSDREFVMSLFDNLSSSVSAIEISDTHEMTIMLSTGDAYVIGERETGSDWPWILRATQGGVSLQLTRELGGAIHLRRV